MPPSFLAAFILATALWLEGVGVLHWFPIQLVAAISITELAKQMVSQSGFTRVIVAPGSPVPTDLPLG